MNTEDFFILCYPVKLTRLLKAVGKQCLLSCIILALLLGSVTMLKDSLGSLISQSLENPQIQDHILAIFKEGLVSVFIDLWTQKEGEREN